MSQQVLVEKALAFKGDATDNIEGNMSFKKLVWMDDFTGLALDSERWTFAGDNGGTEAITTATNGTVTLTLGGIDDDRSIIASPLILLCSKNPVVEARFKVSAATAIGFNFGFNDTATEGDNAMAMEITGGAATLVNGKSTDAAGFIFDTDGSVDRIYVAAVKADTEGTPVLAKAVGWFTNGTGRADNQPIQLAAGSTTVTTTGIGMFIVWLPEGCAGTATDGTGTFTGSPIALTAGSNAITSTVAGTVVIAYGYTPSTSFLTYRVALDTAGNADFFINGNTVGRLPACITTTAPLCVFLEVIARAAAAKVLTCDYIKVWQDR